MHSIKFFFKKLQILEIWSIVKAESDRPTQQVRQFWLQPRTFNCFLYPKYCLTHCVHTQHFVCIQQNLKGVGEKEMRASAYRRDRIISREYGVLLGFWIGFKYLNQILKCEAGYTSLQKDTRDNDEKKKLTWNLSLSRSCASWSWGETIDLLEFWGNWLSK